MANCLDIVAIAVVDESAVVVWMILRAKPGRSVVFAAGRDRGIIECFDGGAIRCREGDMVFRGLGTLAEPEIRPVLPHPHRLAEIHQHLVSQWSQRGLKKAFAFSDVRNWQADMIDHDCPSADSRKLRW